MTNRDATRSPFDSSRFVFEESSKRRLPNAGPKKVHFEANEASFSEHAPLRVTPQGHRVKSRLLNERTQSSTLANLLVMLPALALTIVLAYSELPPLGLPNLSNTFAGIRQRVLSGLQGPDIPPCPSHIPACPSPPERFCEDIAIRMRWGSSLRPDYALSANGGKIVLTLTSSLDRTRRRTTTASLGPEAVISEDSSVGNCWSMGVSGQIGLSTPTVIYPTHVTVEHIPRQIAVDIGRAPRHMILWGVIDGLSNVHKHRWLVDEMKAEPSSDSPFRGHHSPPLTANHAFVALATFEYDISSPLPVQTFAVYDGIVASRMDFGVFVLEIADNWGGADTCLYRVQIHGEPALVVEAVAR